MEKLFWPDLFIIGGGLSKSSEKFFPLINIKTPMIPAQFLNQAGIIGAAIYAAEKGDLAASASAD
jgi:polyphosphate glucokinase